MRLTSLWKSPFDIHSYDTLSRIFQHAKIQFGNIDIVVAFLPSGLPGELADCQSLIAEPELKMD